MTLVLGVTLLLILCVLMMALSIFAGFLVRNDMNKRRLRSVTLYLWILCLSLGLLLIPLTIWSNYR